MPLLQSPRDGVCLGIAALVGLMVVMCFWVVGTSMGTARHQVNAILAAVKSCAAIEFRLQTNGVNVTGRLLPRVSSCTDRLRFDGRVVLTSPASSEELVLTSHRGYRRPRDGNARCVTTQDIPPLHTIEDVDRGAFTPGEVAQFGANCASRPVQVTFNSMPFVVCAEDWLRATAPQEAADDPVANASSDGAPLRVYGKHVVLTARLLSSTDATVDNVSDVPSTLHRCEYLEAPMTSGDSCPIRPRCPSPELCKTRSWK